MAAPDTFLQLQEDIADSVEHYNSDRVEYGAEHGVGLITRSPEQHRRTDVLVVSKFPLNSEATSSIAALAARSNASVAAWPLVCREPVRGCPLPRWRGRRT
jgi:hypothetical protein